MTTVYLAPTFGAGYQGFSAGGIPLNAGKIYTYAAGGTTPRATYTTSAGSVQNANPIILDAGGRTPNEIWLIAGDNYRFDLKDASDNLIKTYDNLTGINDISVLEASSGSSLIGYISAGTGAVATTVQAKLRETFSVKDFGAVGDGVTDDTTAFANAIAYAATLVPAAATYTYGTVGVLVPAGSYLISSITLPTGVGLICPNGVALLQAKQAGIMIDTTVYNSGNAPSYNGVLENIDLYGLGYNSGAPSSTALIGIRLNNTQNFILNNVRFSNIQDQAWLCQSKFDGSTFTGSAICNSVYATNVIGFDCNLNVARSSRAGTFEFNGGDSFRFQTVEAFSSGSRTLSSSNKYCVAWYFYGSLNDSRALDIYGSSHDQGAYIDSSCTVLTITSSRFDSNFAEQEICNGSAINHVGVEYNTSALAANNTYDTLSYGAASENCQDIGCTFFNLAANTNWPRYHIADAGANANRPNRHIGPIFYSPRTGNINNSGGTASITAQSAGQNAYKTNTATADATLTAANILGAPGVVLNLTGTLGGDAAATLPTVADLIAGDPNLMEGQTYRLRIINSSSANHVWTVTTNTGWTLNGTMTIAQNTWREFIVSVTSATAAALQSVGTGTYS